MSLIALLLASLAAPPASADIDAAALYAAKCAACHARDGRGNAVLAKPMNLSADQLSLVSSRSAKKTEAELAKITAEGAGKMPAFKAKLKPEEIAALARFVKKLGAKP